MQVWTMARARATMGGPGLVSRMACNAALFHCTTTVGELSPVLSAQAERMRDPRGGATAAATPTAVPTVARRRSRRVRRPVALAPLTADLLLNYSPRWVAGHSRAPCHGRLG